MSKLDYSGLKHSKPEKVLGYSVRNSFYMQKGTGKAGHYRGNYTGDRSVFSAARSVMNQSYDMKLKG